MQLEKLPYNTITLAGVGGVFTDPISFCLHEFFRGGPRIGRFVLHRSMALRIFQSVLGFVQGALVISRFANLRSRGG